MSTPASTPQQVIPHQDKLVTQLRKVFPKKAGGSIADLPAAGAAYVQAEATATRTTVNAILAKLRTAGLIDS